MVRFFIFVLFSLVLGAVLYAVLGNEPGYLLVSWGNWAVETSLLMGLIGVLAVVFLLYTVRQLFRLFRPLWRWPSAARHQEVADTATLRGLRKLAHGYPGAAYKELIENARHARSPLLNYLGAFLGALQLGDDAGMRFTLRKAESLAGHQQLPVGLLKSALLIRDGELESALAVLLDLHRRHGDNPAVLIMLRDVLLRLEDWDQLAGILPALSEAPVSNAHDIDALRLQVAVERLRAFDPGKGTSDELEAIREALPRELRTDERVIEPYVRQLMVLGEYERAQVTLIRFFRNQWSDSLVRLTGYIETHDPAPLRVLLEKQLQDYPGNALLSLSLGRICVRERALEKAKEHLEAAAVFSADESLSAEINVELGRLLEHLGDAEGSQACYRKAIMRYARSMPDLPYS